MEATERTLLTMPADHGNCSVGSLTHGLISFAEAAARDDVAAILTSGWVSPEAAAALPVVQPSPAAIRYGPLADAEGDVDIVLIRIDGRGLMTLKDAEPDMLIVGKPQCHIVALAQRDGVVAASVGCALSRARTGMRPEEMTCALPGRRLDAILDSLEAAATLDLAMARYAAEDAKRFGPRARQPALRT